MPLGLPAQKGWEVYSPLPGSHHPRLSGKFVIGSVFIDAFHNLKFVIHSITGKSRCQVPLKNLLAAQRFANVNFKALGNYLFRVYYYLKLLKVPKGGRKAFT